MKDLYTAHVTVTSGRDGSALSSDGRLDVRLGFPVELGGDGAAANPEQLFAAGYAACFASSIKAAARTLGVSVGSVSVDARATLAVDDAGAFIVRSVRLEVHAGNLDGRGEAVIAEAKRICAYSNATRGVVTTDVVQA
jgi:Ohr subfamily peroxiredoxin